jgi:hypothetical protein
LNERDATLFVSLLSGRALNASAWAMMYQVPAAVPEETVFGMLFVIEAPGAIDEDSPTDGDRYVSVAVSSVEFAER